jgi:uncharacterized membrane protein
MTKNYYTRNTYKYSVTFWSHGFYDKLQISFWKTKYRLNNQMLGLRMQLLDQELLYSSGSSEFTSTPSSFLWSLVLFCICSSLFVLFSFYFRSFNWLSFNWVYDYPFIVYKSFLLQFLTLKMFWPMAYAIRVIAKTRRTHQN